MLNCIMSFEELIQKGQVSQFNINQLIKAHSLQVRIKTYDTVQRSIDCR